MLCRVVRGVLGSVKSSSRFSLRSKSSVTGPLSNRFYLFNYFEKPRDEEVFKSVWIEGSEYVVERENFVATYLHRSIDPNAKYPWVNFALTQSLDICFFGKPDEFWTNYIDGVVKHGFKANPAAFREIASFKGDDLIAEDKERPTTHRFLITGLKATPEIKDEDIEGNWQELTGADLVHSSGAKSVVDTHLYKRVMMAPLFRYVARTEFTAMDDDVSGQKIAEMVDNRSGTTPGVETVSAFYQVEIPLKAK